MPRAGFIERRCRGNGRQHGYIFLLLAASVVLILVALLVSAISSPAIQNQRNAAAAAALAQARNALLGYAATYRDTHSGEVFGFLPCPDSDNDGSAALPDTPCASKNQTVIGRLPYKTLGLTNLQDDWGECLWYAVSGSAKNNPKTDSMTWDTYGTISVLNLSGASLAVAGSQSGALAVIFAPGAALPASSRGAGSGPCPGIAGNDIANYLDGGYSTPVTGSLTVTRGKPGSSSNNDQLVWLNVGDIFRLVKRRSDFPIQIQTLTAAIETCLKTALNSAQAAPAAVPSQLLPASTGDPAAFNGKLAGVVPTSTDCGIVASDPMKDYWDNWRAHFRYVACAGLANVATVGDPPCLTNTDSGTGVATQCYGVVVFGGERTSGQTRTNALAASVAADYVEGINLAAFNPAAIPGTNLAGPSTFTISNPATAVTQDITLCIRP